MIWASLDSATVLSRRSCLFDFGYRTRFLMFCDSLMNPQRASTRENKIVVLDPHTYSIVRGSGNSRGQLAVMHVQFKDAARFEISFTARKPNVSGEAADSANVECRFWACDLCCVWECHSHPALAGGWLRRHSFVASKKRGVAYHPAKAGCE